MVFICVRFILYIVRVGEIFPSKFIPFHPLPFFYTSGVLDLLARWTSMAYELLYASTF